MEEKDLTFRFEVYNYALKKYKTKIEYLWLKYPNYAVLRNNSSNKWYGIIMDIPYSKLGIEKDGIVDILNVKVADLGFKDFLINQKGIYNGYHIARGTWVSILIDGTVELENIFNLLDESYVLASARKKQTR